MSRTLIVGDVHGCASQLGRLVQEVNPTRLILVGDLFTRGPDPQGVWKLIKHHRAEAVLGNNDQKVLDHWKPGAVLPRKAFRWLSERPHALHGSGWNVVHAGVHPKGGLRHTPRRMAMNLRRWPSAEGGRAWWWERYQGEELVLYGHDAANGLNDRRPWSIGLDTGCVRSGALSGFLLEQDRVVQVRRER